jgi:hypothetical protein
MSDGDRLNRTLAKLGAASAAPGAEGRELAPGGEAGGDLLAAVLTEVDETILARRLNFHTDTGTRFACEAYGRRLLSLVQPLPDEVTGAALSGRPLDGLEEEEIALLRRVFEELLDGATRLTVIADPLPEARDPALLGMAAARLAETWGLELGGGLPPDPAAALDRILDACASAAVAWMRLDENATAAEGGSEAGLAKLSTFASAGLDAFRARERTEGTEPRCVVLGRQDAGGALLVVAEAAGQTVLMLLQPAELKHMTAAWRSVFR